MTTHNQAVRGKLQESLELAYKLMGVLDSFTEEEINELDRDSQHRLGMATEKATTTWKLIRLCRVNPSSHQDQPAIGLISPGTGYHGEEARIQEIPVSFFRQAAKNAENNPKD